MLFIESLFPQVKLRLNLNFNKIYSYLIIIIKIILNIFELYILADKRKYVQIDLVSFSVIFNDPYSGKTWSFDWIELCDILMRGLWKK